MDQNIRKTQHQLRDCFYAVNYVFRRKFRVSGRTSQLWLGAKHGKHRILNLNSYWLRMHLVELIYTTYALKSKTFESLSNSRGKRFYSLGGTSSLIKNSMMGIKLIDWLIYLRITSSSRKRSILIPNYCLVPRELTIEIQILFYLRFFGLKSGLVYTHSFSQIHFSQLIGVHSSENFSTEYLTRTQTFFFSFFLTTNYKLTFKYTYIVCERASEREWLWGAPCMVSCKVANFLKRICHTSCSAGSMCTLNTLS